ncbi:hypothetical protein [Mycoplasma suis]|uniref:Uncharacterized protein n=2 Tax=Mycoplasma suis TaxID=57372 RepID=F0QRK5_MYCSL|nr:hypothetical protein [Mycoplasma suis]ADX98125.1 hypothetical protein MSU_0593 [Mycoplasma suis str. Illinois]CBZ40637.1 hypothetical protein MSUIS_05440 [Mycoplasma suis KI3806]
MIGLLTLGAGGSVAWIGYSFLGETESKVSVQELLKKETKCQGKPSQKNEEQMMKEELYFSPETWAGVI